MKIHELKAFLESDAEEKVETETTSVLAVEEKKPTASESVKPQSIRRTKLQMREGVHDKEYILEVFEERDEASGNMLYTLVAHWGRIGSHLQSQIKVQRQAGVAFCTQRYVELVNEKQRKGYKVVDRWER